MAKLVLTHKVNNRNKVVWGHSGGRQPRYRGTGFLAGAEEIPTLPRQSKGPVRPARAQGTRRTPAPRTHPGTLTLEPGSSSGRHSQRLTPRAKGPVLLPPGGAGERARGARSARESGAPRASLPAQAEGAAPLVQQAEHQERGPRQRGVSRRQVLAVGRHGTA